MGKSSKVKLLADSAYEIIRNRILGRTLRPGEALVEAKLANELKMSRTPVRDALKRLKHEGLVNSAPNRGFSVESSNPEDFAETYDLRELLEGYAARLLSKRITPSSAKVLKELAANADKPTSTTSDETKFHSAIIQMCNSRKVAEASRLLSLNVLTYNQSTKRLTHSNGLPIFGQANSKYSHSSLAEKIISGDSNEAEKAIRYHIRLGKQTMLKLLLGIDFIDM